MTVFFSDDETFTCDPPDPCKEKNETLVNSLAFSITRNG